MMQKKLVLKAVLWFVVSVVLIGLAGTSCRNYKLFSQENRRSISTIYSAAAGLEGALSEENLDRLHLSDLEVIVAAMVAIGDDLSFLQERADLWQNSGDEAQKRSEAVNLYIELGQYVWKDLLQQQTSVTRTKLTVLSSVDRDKLQFINEVNHILAETSQEYTEIGIQPGAYGIAALENYFLALHSNIASQIENNHNTSLPTLSGGTFSDQLFRDK